MLYCLGNITIVNNGYQLHFEYPINITDFWHDHLTQTQRLKLDHVFVYWSVYRQEFGDVIHIMLQEIWYMTIL